MATKNKHYSVYVTDDEAQEVESAAAFYGLKISKLFLLSVLKELPQPEELKNLWSDFLIQVSLMDKNQKRIALDLEMLRKQYPEVKEIEEAIIEARQTGKETAKLVKKLSRKF
jgi:hypothetical protein